MCKNTGKIRAKEGIKYANVLISYVQAWGKHQTAVEHSASGEYKSIVHASDQYRFLQCSFYKNMGEFRTRLLSIRVHDIYAYSVPLFLKAAQA